MKKKIILLSLIFSMIFYISGCVDYGYFFHFCVDGGNGEIAVNTTDSFNPTVGLCKDGWCELDCNEDSYFISLMGSKNGRHELTFVATPTEGYQVKEWLFNGEIVKNNKSNSYTATVTSKENYNGTICVRFEPISIK